MNILLTVTIAIILVTIASVLIIKGGKGGDDDS